MLSQASSVQARSAAHLLTQLQQDLVRRLENVSSNLGQQTQFGAVDWLRDGGKHGGGQRFISVDNACYNRAAVNYSQIHYPDLPEKALASATALSTIVHPQNPFAPSMHMHISWTELKSGKSYWRIMADLNPSLPDPDQTEIFARVMHEATGEIYYHGREEGASYFYIPALKRHRGVTHFYLESYCSADPAQDFALAKALGSRVIGVYPDLIEAASRKHPEPDRKAKQAQLNYHSLYFLQVLTLDRGTTSGLMVHNQNDVGILGSLPGYVDRDLLLSWLLKVESPQDKLLARLLDALPQQTPTPVSDLCRAELAEIVRQFYLEHPEALKMQARASIIPPTLANHA